MSDIGGEGVQEGNAFEYLIRRGIQRKGEWRVEGEWFIEEGGNGKERREWVFEGSVGRGNLLLVRGRRAAGGVGWRRKRSVRESVFICSIGRKV